MGQWKSFMLAVLAVAFATVVHTQEVARPESQRALELRIANWAFDLGVLAGAGPQYEAASVILSVEWAVVSCVNNKRRVTCSREHIKNNIPIWTDAMEYALSVDATSDRPASPVVRGEMKRIASEMRTRSWLHRLEEER